MSSFTSLPSPHVLRACSSAGACFDREGMEDQVQTEIVIVEGGPPGMGWGSSNRKERDEDKEGEKRLGFAKR